MKYGVIYLFFFLIIFAFACSNSKPDRQMFLNAEPDSALYVEYAKGFAVNYYGKHKLITVSNPWQGARKVEYQYVLSPDSANHEDKKTIQYPVNSVICLSTTHIAMIAAIDEHLSIEGVSGDEFIMNERIRKRIRAGFIKDVGHSQALNYETILNRDPDIMFAYEVKGETSYANKLDELGVQVVFNGDYLETSPLGKAEWIKFIAAFYNKEKLAQNYFKEVKSAYKRIRQLTDSVKKRPVVFTGLPFKGTWYVPGGNSYLAKLIRDAGGDYIWSNNNKRESLALSIESVFSKARKADVWINTGRKTTYRALKQTDKRFAQLSAFQNDRVFNNNARTNGKGGNDFWETGTIEPHILLKDMVKLFHPDLLPDHKLKYYHKLQ